MRYPGSKPEITEEVAGYIVAALYKIFPDAIDDIIEAITGIEDGDTDDLGSFFINLRKLFLGQSITTDPSGWFTGLATSLFRQPIQVLANLLGLIPIVGQNIENTLTNYLAATANTAATASSAAAAAQSQVSTLQSAVQDLQDQAQYIQVPGYASRYMSTGAGVQTTPTTLNFDTKKGPSVNVTLMSGGRFRLDQPGLWRFEAQAKFNDSKWSPPRCFMDIVIRNPSGVEEGRIEAMATSDAPLTITNVMPYVIPSAGYTVEVQAWTSSLPLIGAAWRTIGSGPRQTNFSVFKISSETS